MSKKVLAITISALIIIILAMGWIYPFSFVSFNKSFSYQADRTVVTTYNSDLHAFKQQSDVGTNGTTLGDALELLSDPIFTTTKRAKVNYSQLERIQADLKSFRTKLINLNRISEGLDNERTQQYMYLLIDNSEYMEDQIEDLLDSSFDTRKSLRNQFGEFHTNITVMLDHLITFYETYQSEE